jgi:putative ABC transport system permease protein
MRFPRLQRFLRAGGLFDGDTWYEVWASLRRNRLRAILTALGVSWGIFMLILLLGLGRGLETGTKKTIGSLSPNAIYIWGQRTSIPHAGLMPGRYLKYRNADIDLIRSIRGVRLVAPRLRLGGWRQDGLITFRTKTSSVNVLGDSPALAQIENLDVVEGRYLNQRDMDDRRKVVVLGRKAREAVFGQAPGVGETVRVNGAYFLVVGEIASSKGGDEADRLENAAYVPFTTYQRVYNQPDRVGWFAVGLEPGVDAPAVERAIKQALAARHRVHPDDLQAIGSFNAAEKFEQIQGLFRGIRIFVWFVGTMTLFAGALGVSNILLIAVKERTKEIGVRKALGATPASVIGLVLQESVALTTLAGYSGLVAGVGALEAISSLVAQLSDAPIQRPEVDLKAALWATFALIVAGAVAGIVPARLAARVAPVEALRAE